MSNPLQGALGIRKKGVIGMSPHLFKKCWGFQLRTTKPSPTINASSLQSEASEGILSGKSCTSSASPTRKILVRLSKIEFED